MKKYISSIVFFLFSASMLLGQGPYYINLDDASGFDRSPYQTQLEAAAAEIIEVLPEEYQSQFKVFDFGSYVHNEVFVDGFAPSLDRAKSLAASQSSFYLLFVKETTKEGVYKNFRVEVVLPRNSNFLCVTDETIEIARDFTLIATENSFNNADRVPTFYAEAEIQGMEKFKRRVNHMFNCCTETEENSCSADLPTNQEMVDLLTSSRIHPTQRYVKLENVSNISITNASPGYGFSKEVWVDITESGTGSLQPVGFTDDLIELQTEGNSSGFTVNIALDFFDQDNFDEATLLQYKGSSSDGVVTTLPLTNLGNPDFEPNSYGEHIIILDLEDDQPPVILTKVEVGYEGASLFSVDDPRNNDDLQEDVLVLPIVAYVGRIIVKRAIMASVNVAINMVMHVVIEKTFGHDDCTWSQAFFASNITGWHLAIWAAEGAISGGVTNYVKSAFSSGFFAAAEYVMTTPSSSFQMSGVFINFGAGVVLGVGFGVIAGFVTKAFNRYVRKMDFEGNITGLVEAEFREACKEFFDSKYITSNLEGGFFVGLSKWFRSFDALRSFQELRSNGWCIDLMKKYKAQFQNVNNTAIRDGISGAAEGTTQRVGF